MDEHYMRDEDMRFIVDEIQERGTPMMTLPHGGKVYDLDGQNVCLISSSPSPTARTSPRSSCRSGNDKRLNC